MGLIADYVEANRERALMGDIDPCMIVNPNHALRFRYPVAFNAQQHRKPMNTEDDPEEVILQTMGFRYLGDDGDWQQYNAQVVPKPSLKNASKSDRLEKKESGPRNQQASNHDRQSKPPKILFDIIG